MEQGLKLLSLTKLMKTKKSSPGKSSKSKHTKKDEEEIDDMLFSESSAEKIKEIPFGEDKHDD